MSILKKIRHNVGEGAKKILHAPRAIAKRFGLSRRHHRHHRR